MKTLYFLGLLLLTGCGASLMPYTSNSVDYTESKAIIDRYFMEQPAQFRPESVEFTADFIAIRSGYSTRGKSNAIAVPIGNLPVLIGSGRQSGTSKELVTRIYYDSIGSVKLYKRRGHFLVTIRDHENLNPVNVFSHSLEKSKRFVDAMNSIRTK